MRVTAFTCVVGATPDVLRTPSGVNGRVRYVCFTDRTKAAPFPYETVNVEVLGSGVLASAYFSRRLKILADHPALAGCDVLLWHDAAFRLDADPLMVARHTLTPDLDLVAFKHPDRTQIEDEAVAIAKCKYAELATVQAQAAAYRAEGFTQTVITSTGYSLRRKTAAVEAFHRIWWAEVERWCWRDQMSVDYALWKAGLVCGYIPGHYRHNPYATWFKAPEPSRRMASPHRAARPSWPFPKVAR